MANGLFNTAKKMIMDGSLDLLVDTIKVMLIDTGYTFNPDDDYVSVITGAPSKELSGTGYVGGFGGSGRKALANKSIVANKTVDKAVFDADDLTWAAIQAGTVYAAVLIKEVTSDADSILIGYIDTGTGFPKVTNGGDLTVQWSADGILTLA